MKGRVLLVLMILGLLAVPSVPAQAESAVNVVDKNILTTTFPDGLRVTTSPATLSESGWVTVTIQNPVKDAKAPAEVTAVSAAKNFRAQAEAAGCSSSFQVWVSVPWNGPNSAGKYDISFNYNGRGYVIDPWWNLSWNSTVRLNFDTLTTGITSNLANFPVMVRLNSSRITWANIQADLDDLRFIDADNVTVLDYEIEKNDYGTEAILWVKVPLISANSTTDHVWIYYDNPAAGPGANPSGVWASDAVMVQHMGDATTSTILDSTSYSNDGAKKAANEPIQTTSGKIDSAQTFDGSNDVITIPNNANLNGASITYEAWVNPNNLSGYHFILSRGGGLNEIETYGSSFKAEMTTTSGTAVLYTASGKFTVGVWKHIAVTYNGVSVWKIYIDGVNTAFSWLGTPLTGSLSPGTGALRIGNRPTELFFNGVIDEIRQYSSAKSAGWIKAEYVSGSDTFITWGDPVYLTKVIVTSSPAVGTGYVTVDGAGIVTPATYYWEIGSTYTLAAISPVTITAGQSRYAYTSWSDAGAQSHVYTVPNATDTVTATYHTEYYLSLSSDTAGAAPSGTGWYANGTVTTIATNATIATTDSVSPFRFWKWSLGGVDQTANASNPFNVTMTDYAAAKAIYSGEKSMSETLLFFNGFAIVMTLLFMGMWSEKDRFVAERILIGVFAAALWMLAGNVLSYVDPVLFAGVEVFYMIMVYLMFVACMASVYQLMTLRSHRWEND